MINLFLIVDLTLQIIVGPIKIYTDLKIDINIMKKINGFFEWNVMEG